MPSGSTGGYGEGACNLSGKRMLLRIQWMDRIEGVVDGILYVLNMHCIDLSAMERNVDSIMLIM